jgi:hypothetical protein
MRMTRFGVVALGLFTSVACGGSSSEATGQGPGDDSGVPDLDGGVIEGPDPGDIPNVGIFVSASRGIEGADGSKAHPVRRLAEAIELAAKQTGVPVIACAETYNEAVTLADGISVFGYFDCSSAEWKRVTKHSVIASPTSPAVSASNITSALRFEGFDVSTRDMPQTPSTSGPAASAIGMMVRSSKLVTIGEVNIVAGHAQPGTDGVEPPPTTGSNPDGNLGGPQAAITICVILNINYCNRQFWPGGSGGGSVCSNGRNGGAGGDGGDGQYFLKSGGSRGLGAVFTGAPNAATPTTQRGGAERSNGTSGTSGASGDAGKNGEWKLDLNGFTAGDGTAGGDGVPGQGGGGGGGSSSWMCPGGPCSLTGIQNDYHAATGGGGGAGGCGGSAGSPGSGGGGSIGLLVVASTDITIRNARITAGNGGAAGKGTLGTTGTRGGIGGNGGTTGDLNTRGGSGGNGGAGGDAGPSGNGAPGPSIALAYSGARPRIDGNVELNFGKAGTGQDAISRGSKSVPAVVGIAKAEHAF